MSSTFRIPHSTFRTLFLVGFMASGKTTIGRVLAERLNVPFIDLDEEIVIAAGCTIAEIIQRDGEAAFRQIETECLRQAASRASAVISLGGGAFVQPINREIVAQSGVSVWLDTPFALCWQRIQHDAVVRPLAPTEAEAQARYEQRIPIYELANLRIQIAAESSSESIAAEILTLLQQG